MAAYISFQPSDFFNTVLYTGTGATHSVTGVGFQPDFTWIKQRDGTYYQQLYDSARGAGYHLASNDTAAQSALDTAGLSAWGADGFTVNTRAQSNYNTGTFSSLMQANQYVQVIEERQGRKIGCIEEAAYRMGYINYEQLLAVAEPLRKSGYGEYLVKLANKK